MQRKFTGRISSVSIFDAAACRFHTNRADITWYIHMCVDLIQGLNAALHVYVTCTIVYL